MIDIVSLVYLMVCTPLICAVLLFILKFMFKNMPDYINFAASTFLSLCSLSSSVLLFEYVITYQGYTLESNYPVCIVQNIPLYFGIYADNLTSLFTLLTGGFFLIANIFSYKYLRQNRQGFARFYIYLNLLQFFSFCFFLSSNLIQSVVFMMATSLACYLFANFYFQKPHAQNSSKKLFMTDLTGDFILISASVAFLFFSTLVPDTANMPTLGFNNINSLGLYSFASLNPFMFAFICVLFVIGAIIKSSQFPFMSKITLCADAPNPAFSVILSPVVLAQGVFLLYRLYPLLNLAEGTFEIVKIIGIITAILACAIALRENGLKQICSWVAISQIGIAMCALGFKMYETSVFYLICSGLAATLICYSLDCVSYCSGSQENIRFLGGLREKSPFLAVSYILGALSLSGLLFSGFYPKTELINNLAFEKSSIYASLFLIILLMSTFYLFRVYFRVFEGGYRGSYEVQKTSKLMKFAILLLCIPVVFFGLIFAKYSGAFLSFSSLNKVSTPDFFVNVFAFIASIFGYYLAYNIYFTKRISSLRVRFLRRIAAEHFWCDYFIDFLFEKLPLFVAKILLFFEKYLIGILYTLVKLKIKIISFVKEKLETNNINSEFFTFVLWMFLIALIFVILYFKTGVIN